MRILRPPCGVVVAYVLLASSTAHPDELAAEVRTSAWHERVGIGLSLGGGIDDFVSEALRDMTSLGGSWNVRATLGTRSFIAGEVSYIGAAQSIAAPGFDADAVLVGNGLQAAVRLDVLSTHDVRSFVYGGAAWRHYDLLDIELTPATADADDDDVFEAPIGLGIAGHAGSLVAELRAEYRPGWGSDLMPLLARSDDDAILGDADRWGVTGNVGMEF